LPERLLSATLAGARDDEDGVAAEAAALARGDVSFDGAVKQMFLLGETFAPAMPPDRTQLLIRSLNVGVAVIGRAYVGRAEAVARTDALTTLPNERVFLEDLDGATARVESTGGRFAVAAIDLDGLKVANDEFGGHAAGDHYIRRFAAELLQAARPRQGRAYRLHGDEFFVIFRDRVRAEAEAVLEALQDRPEVAPFSYGVAESPGDGVDPEVLIHIADRERLYEMKESRPGRAQAARAWLRSPQWDFEGRPAQGRSVDESPLVGLRRVALDIFDRLCRWVQSERRRRGI
jgi:diguanylate cyclase (GGDEF)-like protein